MRTLFEIISLLIEWRIDAIAVALALFGGYTLVLARLRKRATEQDFPRISSLAIPLVAIGGALVAEWFGLLVEHAPGSTLKIVAIARFLTLGSAAVIGGVVLWVSHQLAILRAKARIQSETEHQLHRAVAAADEANRAKSDFLAVMSHEIRTPLNAVMGFAKLLTETRLDDIQKGYVSTIASEGERLGSLINDILDLTKIEAGQLVLERLPFAPAEIAHEVLRLLSARALEKRIDLRFEAQLAGTLLVAGDPLRFRQILLNLVDNALKFTSTGTVTVFLSWKAPEDSEPRGRLRLRVRDTGIGIPEGKQKDLFQKFMQVDSSTTRNYGGTGLGLAICQRLVHLMGGEISVVSTLGKGSEFTFWLSVPPVALPESPEDETASEPPLTRRPRVLIVDDIETNRFLLEIFLRRHGFDPTLAKGGEEAVELATSIAFDAILMDLQMPDVDGYAAARRIRAAEPPGRHTPIIALTASIAKGTREKCLDAGMDEYLAKPLDLDRFKRVLRKLIAAHIESPKG
jgi:signal transduction histidine kinase/CheY-like chemotaxis protein